MTRPADADADTDADTAADADADTDAYLALETGAVVEGRCRVPGETSGELVFTTAYAGYEESLTDPSYARQVLTFAYPLIGNYGVRPERFESEGVHPSAALAREFTDEVAEWLGDEGTPAVDHLDTRDLVLAIRDAGAMRCGIAAGPGATPDDARAQLDACPPMGAHTDIGAAVSVDEPVVYDGSGPGPDGSGPGPDGSSPGAGRTAPDVHVALLDCGAKRSIVDSLLARGARVTVLPYDATPADVAGLDPAVDLLFVSNGPGDPATFGAAERLVDRYVGELPVAGICLGQQVVANALGGSTGKMAFGHRGVNQPVRDLGTDRVVMTTQNHGYTVDDVGPLSVTQVNVNDGTAEGLASADLAVLTRQYHPEANPGPRDSLSFFDDALAMAEAGGLDDVPTDPA